MKIKATSLILVFTLSLFFCVSAIAEPIDYDRKGSITITMQYDGESIESGSFTIFHVADVIWDYDQYTFEYTNAFTDCGIGFEELDSEVIAQNYAEFVKRNSIDGVKKQVGAFGAAIFTDLSTGLYLVIQEDSADGYTAASPFLISLPIRSEDGWLYEVDATPKMDFERAPTPPSEPDIPQTGQLKWPIPVLAVLGIAVFTLGWVLCFKKRKDR